MWKPDGAHGMYSWAHVLLTTACALVAWYSIYRMSKPDTSDETAVSTP